MNLRILAAWLALAAAGLGAVMTTINAARRTTQSQVAANAYLSLETDARVAREVDLPQQHFEQARAALGELVARRDEINKSADIPSFMLTGEAGATSVKDGLHPRWTRVVASTTAKAFDEFLSKIALTDTQWDTVKSRQTTAHTYLAESFDAASDMPLQLTKLIGSAGRRTIVRPLDDIDLLAVFDDSEVWSTYQWNSWGFINRIRDALNKYAVQIVGTRGQAVRLFYKTPPHVDIAPVFKYTSGSYALPNGSGGWLTTDPEYHEGYIDTRNAQLGYHLKPMARMLKRWNNVHSHRLKSFHLEMMVSNIFLSLGSNYRDATYQFVSKAPYYLHVTDPAGHSGDLAANLTWKQQQDVTSSFNSAEETARRALQAEQDGDHAEAIRQWRIVFGSEFPPCSWYA